MAYYKKCSYCGANLDPGEPCQCHEGYKGIGPEEGIFVRKEDAYRYAFERCTKGNKEDIKEFQEMLLEWYYSGNWIKVG